MHRQFFKPCHSRTLNFDIRSETTVNNAVGPLSHKILKLYTETISKTLMPVINTNHFHLRLLQAADIGTCYSIL